MLTEDLCHTNKLPASLEHLLRSLFDRDIQSPAELLVAFVYYLFLECGFAPNTLSAEEEGAFPVHWGYSFAVQIPESSWNMVADQIVEQYTQWTNSGEATNTTKSEQSYKFNLNLVKCPTGEMQLVIRKVFGGSALCIIFCANQHSESSSVILSVAEYINTAAINGDNFHTIQQDPQSYFTNVRGLSEKIKHNLIAPVFNLVMYESAFPHFSLNCLPEDVLCILFKYLRSDLKALQNVSQTCTYLRNAAISFLHLKNIQLKQRHPTPIVHDTSNTTHRRRIHMFNPHPWFFHRFNYFPQFP